MVMKICQLSPGSHSTPTPLQQKIAMIALFVDVFSVQIMGPSVGLEARGRKPIPGGSTKNWWKWKNCTWSLSLKQSNMRCWKIMEHLWCVNVTFHSRGFHGNVNFTGNATPNLSRPWSGNRWTSFYVQPGRARYQANPTWNQVSKGDMYCSNVLMVVSNDYGPIMPKIWLVGFA